MSHPAPGAVALAGGDGAAARMPLSALALALVLPTFVWFATALTADHIAYGEGSEQEILDRLAMLFSASSLLTAMAHTMAFVATLRLTRVAPFSSSVLAQPTGTFAALRMAGAFVLAAASLWPSLRQPLVTFAIALFDAAFVASLLTLLAHAPVPTSLARRAKVIAAIYALYRVGSAAAPFLPVQHIEIAALVHRVLAVVVVAAVAGVVIDVVRALRRSP